MIHCFKCGSDLHDNMIYCLQCGDRLETDTGAETVIAQMRPATDKPARLDRWVKAVVAIALLAGMGLGVYWVVFAPNSIQMNTGPANTAANDQPANIVVSTPTPTPAVSKAKPSPTQAVALRPKTGCYLWNDGKGVTLRLDCETKDCNKDKQTVAMTVPDGTSVALSPAPPAGNWRVILIGNQTYYVAASRVICN